MRQEETVKNARIPLSLSCVSIVLFIYVFLCVHEIGYDSCEYGFLVSPTFCLQAIKSEHLGYEAYCIPFRTLTICIWSCCNVGSSASEHERLWSFAFSEVTVFPSFPASPCLQIPRGSWRSGPSAQALRLLPLLFSRAVPFPPVCTLHHPSRLSRSHSVPPLFPSPYCLMVRVPPYPPWCSLYLHRRWWFLKNTLVVLFVLGYSFPPPRNQDLHYLKCR